MSNLENIFRSDFLCVLMCLEPKDLQGMASVSTSILPLVSRTLNNCVFWRWRFESKLDHKYPSNEPGKTSWLQKYKMITRSDEGDWYLACYCGSGITALLCSNELMDMKFGCEMLDKTKRELTDKERTSTIYYALTRHDDNEDVIKFLANNAMFKMKEYLEEETGNILVDISEHAIKVIADPSLDLGICVYSLISGMIESNEQEKAIILIDTYTYDNSREMGFHLVSAANNTEPLVVKRLLDRDGMVISWKLFNTLWKLCAYECDDELGETAKVLSCHYKTRDYAQA